MTLVSLDIAVLLITHCIRLMTVYLVYLLYYWLAMEYLIYSEYCRLVMVYLMYSLYCRYKRKSTKSSGRYVVQKLKVPKHINTPKLIKSMNLSTRKSFYHQKILKTLCQPLHLTSLNPHLHS